MSARVFCSLVCPLPKLGTTRRLPELRIGGLSNHDDDCNKNVANLHTWQWKIITVHALHVIFHFWTSRNVLILSTTWNVIQSDASMKGLGCVLLQDGRPVYYASRSLSDTERRYKNIKREVLVACWSLEKLNHFIYGTNIILETYHKT